METAGQDKLNGLLSHGQTALPSSSMGFVDSEEKAALQKIKDGLDDAKCKASSSAFNTAGHEVAAAATLKSEQLLKAGLDLEKQNKEESVAGFNFTSSTIRRAFVRKVYLILMLQLSVTFSTAGFFTFNNEAKGFAQRNILYVYGCMIGTLVLTISMACCGDARRRAPLNFILLALFTLLTSTTLGFISSLNSEHHVLFAVGITTVIFLGLILFSFQTKYDFTRWEPYLFISLLVAFIFGCLLFYFSDKMWILVYSALISLLFSSLIIYDTQLILGGKHRYALSPEEYIFAALRLYLDIVQIFQSVLNIFHISSWF